MNNVEPVAWINSKELLVMKGNAYAGAKNWRVNLGLQPEEDDIGLYTKPPQWIGLDKTTKPDIRHQTEAFFAGVQWAETRLKELNT